MFSYRPNYPVDLLVQMLAFESRQQCEDWMVPFQLSFTDLKHTAIDCKTSMAAIPNI